MAEKIYVIQKHNASHLHYDLRLEFNGVLKSWAVPKIPPTEKGVKRLAVEVQDHEKSYANFEGEIKEGYGKGTVETWDKGNYDLIEKGDKKIVVNIHGKKLSGEYVLIKTKLGGKENNWLFFKK
ncbi:3'-phosphoesterase [Candidatus Pacearchaeota archaeon]|nr:3'-phosphoesterase [Candidatus Pacearchaeota archaeon]